jgi:hypothetical protein
MKTFLLIILNLFLIYVTGGIWFGVMIVWGLVKMMSMKR